MKTIKEEIFEAISKIVINYDEFNHEFEGDRTSYKRINRHIETKNYNIDIEIEEEARFNSIDEWETENVDVSELIVTDIHSGQILDTSSYTDDELMELINY